jgi:mannose-1-phosphate guanylyltransferase
MTPSKAVVLVGGEGTRLRPLTETIPKPLIPLVDRPFLSHVFDHLAGRGVRDVLLSSPYLEGRFEEYVENHRGLPKIRWVIEASPLGTAGAVANAAGELDESFFVLNGDILTDLDLTALAEQHRESGAVATITVVPVDDARPYGLVAMEPDGRIAEFREKPEEPIPGVVNAGTYVLEPQAIAGIPEGRMVSIERETFPSLIAAGSPVFGFVSHGYWMDLGTPEKYLQATFDALEGRIEGMDYAAPHVDPGAQVSIQAHLGRWVVVADGASIGEDAEVEDSVILAGAVVEPGARVRASILGPGARVGRGAFVEGAVLAEDASIPAGAESEGARVGAGEVLRATGSSGGEIRSANTSPGPRLDTNPGATG